MIDCISKIDYVVSLLNINFPEIINEYENIYKKWRYDIDTTILIDNYINDNMTEIELASFIEIVNNFNTTLVNIVSELIQNNNENEDIIFLITEIIQKYSILQIINNDNIELITEIKNILITIIQEIYKAMNGEQELLLSSILDLNYENYDEAIHDLIPYFYNLSVLTIYFFNNNINIFVELKEQIYPEFFMKCFIYYHDYFDNSFYIKLILILLNIIIGDNFYAEDIIKIINNIDENIIPTYEIEINNVSKLITLSNDIKFDIRHTVEYNIERFSCYTSYINNEFFIKEFFNFGKTTPYIFSFCISPKLKELSLEEIMNSYMNVHIYKCYHEECDDEYIYNLINYIKKQLIKFGVLTDNFDSINDTKLDFSIPIFAGNKNNKK